jgi:hypothetical protein
VAYADSPSNLLWKLDNDGKPGGPTKGSSGNGISKLIENTKPESDVPMFTEITLDVEPDEPKPMFSARTPAKV